MDDSILNYAKRQSRQRWGCDSQRIAGLLLPYDAVNARREEGGSGLREPHLLKYLRRVVVLQEAFSERHALLCAEDEALAARRTRVLVPVICWQTMSPIEMSARFLFPAMVHISLRSVHMVASPTRRLSISSCSAMSCNSFLMYSWSGLRLDRLDNIRPALSHSPFRAHHRGLLSVSGWKPSYFGWNTKVDVPLRTEDHGKREGAEVCQHVCHITQIHATTSLTQPV